MCVHHILNLVSKSELDSGRIQLRKTANNRKKEAFGEEKDKLKYITDAFRKIQDLDDELWEFWAVPKFFSGEFLQN